MSLQNLLSKWNELHSKSDNNLMKSKELHVKPPKWKALNLNENVKVLLTKHGKKILEDEHYRFFSSIGRLDQNPYVPRKEDENGYCEFQLWSLMQHFGEHIGPGYDNPFVLDILINENDLKDV